MSTLHFIHLQLLGSTRRYGEGTFLAYLKESSIDIVCTGHSHYANVSLIEKNNHQPSMLLHAGSLLCKRSRDGLNSYYLIEAKADGCKIAWRVFKNNAFNTITTHDIDFTKNFSTLKGSMHPM